jgi:membrane fusion protein
VLYRLEALEPGRDKSHGSIVLARPLSFSVLTAAATLAAAALVALFSFAEYTKRTRIVGFTQPDKGLIKLVAPAAGTIVERRVTEGQRVTAGQTLFVISGDRVASEVASTEGVQGSHAAAIAQLRLRRDSLRAEQHRQGRLAEHERHQLQRRLADIGVELAQIDREIATQRRRVQLATERQLRYTELQKASFVSAAAVSEKQEDIIEQQARLQALERGRLQLQRETSQVAAELAQVPLRVDREQAQIERNVLALEQDLAIAEGQREMRVVAPAAGVVTGILVEPGQAVGSAPLATLLPAHASLEAVLFAPSRAAGFIEPGQTVRLRYHAFPYQKFGLHEGTVRQVSRTALTASELPQLIAGELERPEPMYRVTVRLASQVIDAYGQPQPLAAGMQLEADVMQDRRRLIEWVFEPLLGVRGKL